MATQHVISAEIRLATEKYLKSLAEIEARNGQSIDGVVKGSGRAGDAVERDMGRGSKAMDGLGGAAGRLAASLAGAFTFRELVTAAAEMEKLAVGLEAVTGSSTQARAELEYIRALSNRIGADVSATGNAWLGFQAAIKGTAVEGEIGRQVFEAVAVSMAKAGKSSAETSNALLALQQMASKGVVSMEELRGQLGEALPGALQSAANGMGVTTQQLMQMVESGQVAAQDLFPALAKGLNELYGGAQPAQTLAQEITNVKNAFVEMAANIGEAGGLSALKVGAEGAQAAIVLLDAALVSTGKTIGVLVGAFASMDFSQVRTMLAEVEAEAEDKLAKAAQHNDTLRAALKAMGEESTLAKLAQQEAAAATAAAGQAASNAAPNYAALVAAYGEVRKELAAQIELADKNVAAVKARGEAAVAEARLLGDEAALRKAVGQAAADEAGALTALAQKRQTEVDVLRAELENKQVLLKANNDQSDQRKKEIADLEQLIQKKQIEADTTRGQAAAAQANARAKGEEAQAAQAATGAAQAATTARVADAKASLSLLETQRSLAGQSAELARLMGNEEAARSFRIQQLELDVKITRAKAEVQRAEAEGSIAVARATLEELRVKGELTKVKEAELNASIKLAEAKLKEADAIRQSARVTEQAISNLRTFGDEAGRAGDKSKSATDKIAGGWRDVANSVREATEAEKEHQRLMAQKYGRPGEGEKNIFEDGRLSSRGEQLGRGVVEIGSGGSQFKNKDGWASDAKGNAIGQTKQSWLSIYNMVKGMGLSEQQARGIADQAYPNGRYSSGLQQQEMRGQWDAIDVTEAARRAAERMIREGGSAGGVAGVPGAGGAGGASGGASGSASSGVSSGRVASVIRVEMGGARYDVDTTTAAGQQALQSLLSDIGRDRRRAAR